MLQEEGQPGGGPCPALPRGNVPCMASLSRGNLTGKGSLAGPVMGSTALKHPSKTTQTWEPVRAS